MANLQLQLKRETERLEAMRAHLDPNRNTEPTNEEKISPKSVNTENELTGAAAVHKMAQLESNFLAQSLSGGIQNIFGAKAAVAAAAFAGLSQNPMTDRMRTEEPKSKFLVNRIPDTFCPGKCTRKFPKSCSFQICSFWITGLQEKTRFRDPGHEIFVAI